MNKIYLLTRIGGYDYDEFSEKVVLAKCKSDARELSNVTVGAEGKIWNDPQLTACVEIDMKADPHVIVESFEAG